MQWLELCIQTSSAGISLVADRLTVIGYDSFILDDAAEFETFLEENKQYWDYVDESLSEKMAGLSQIRLYLEDGPGAMEAVRGLEEQLALLKRQNPNRDLGTLTIRISNLQDEDWENNWKQYYQPLPIGEKLIVVPQWLDPNQDPSRIAVRLDPGMIFGTGAHASTQMCMMALEKAISGGETVIDLGSGSGILSIAALLLGADTAVGVDIDPKAEDIARENAAYNNLGPDRFTAVTGDVLTDGTMMERLAGDGYDLVLANIVADVIIPLSAVVPRFLKPEGLFLCSGILNTRLDEVIQAVEAAGLEIVERRMMDDWCQLTARVRQGG